MKQSYFSFFIISLILFCSCGSSRNVSYFDDLNKNLNQKITIADSVAMHETKLKPGDELAITVSSINPQVVAPFNLAPADLKGSNYLIDDSGEINFPVLGKLKLEGLTTPQAAALIEKMIKDKYVNDPIVNVRLANFKISVLGAVNAPGTFYFGNQRVSLLDAIAAARDLTLYADRNDVVLIRDVDGYPHHIHFDLTKSSSVFDSPYYHLQQNDILIVNMNKDKQKDAGMTQQKQFNLTLITTAITTVISTVSLIIAVSKK